MIRVRENAESIALYEGEPDEKRRLGRLVRAHLRQLGGDYMNLHQAADLADRVLRPGRRHLPVPGRGAPLLRRRDPARRADADRQRLRAGAGLAVLVRRPVSDTLADWKAIVDRLTTLHRGDGGSPRGAGDRAGFDHRPRRSVGDLVLEDVEVALPNGRVLLDDVDLAIAPGQRLVIQGPSGSGKTTLFRVLAGLWPFGRGIVRLPEGRRSPVPAADALHPDRHAEGGALLSRTSPTRTATPRLARP